MAVRHVAGLSGSMDRDREFWAKKARTVPGFSFLNRLNRLCEGPQSGSRFDNHEVVYYPGGHAHLGNAQGR